MINQNSIKEIKNSKFSKTFCKPLYDSYSFANIIGTIEDILIGKSDRKLPIDVLSTLGKDFDKVVLIFVDALGWRFIEPRLETSKVIKKLEYKGVLSKLTAVFPSTTTAAVPVMSTGMDPVETGLVEWRQYNEKVDDIIMPIKFKQSYNKKLSLSDFDIKPEDIYPASRIYNNLSKEGVKSTLFMHESLINSDFNKALMYGADVFDYLTLNEAFYALAKKIINTNEKHFMYLYLNQVDEIAHKYGAGSKELDLEIDNVLRLIDELIIQPTEGKSGKTLLLITADHGHDVFDPDETFYINKAIPDFEKYLSVNSRNEVIYPGGSSRDVFLYIKPEYLEEAKDKLIEALGELGEVHLSKDLLDQGFFGRGNISESFKKTIGDLVVLPYNGHSVWWYLGDKYLKQSKGQHGGLTRAEMEIPLFAYSL